jgi:predicted double-glycine peptidase
LNELQEQITLEKLLWKEQYRQDAVSMYWVNKALEERINEVIARNIKLEQDLQKAETQAVYATANMEHYRTLFKDMEATNVKLTKENSQLELGNFIWKTGTITLGVTTLYFGLVKPLISR